MMLLRLRVTLFCLMAMLCGALPVIAAEPVKIVTESFPPFNYLEDGEIRGVSTTIVRAAFERAEIPYEIILLPWKRAVRLMEDTPDVFIYTMARNPKREAKYVWVNKLFNRKVSLFRRKDRADLANLSLEDSKKGHTICGVDGTAAIPLLQGLGFIEQNITRIMDESRLKCPAMVSSGRTDFLAANTFSMQHLIASGKLTDIYAEQVVLHEADGYYLAANPNTNAQLIKKIRSAFNELKKEGYLKKVAADHLKSF